MALMFDQEFSLGAMSVVSYVCLDVAGRVNPAVFQYQCVVHPVLSGISGQGWMPGQMQEKGLE